MRYISICILTVLLVSSCGPPPVDTDINEGLGISTEDMDALFGSGSSVPKIYTVQKGDTLFGIANKFNLEVEDIKSLNGLFSNDIIAGMRLKLKQGSAPEPDRGPFFEGGDAFNQDAVAQRKHIDIGQKLVSKKGFLWPVNGTLVNGFAPWRDMDGIEIAANRGENVVSAKGGTVLFRGHITGLGNIVIVKHTFGVMTLYGYLSSIEVNAGQQVDQGSVIGKIGTTGTSAQPMLHLRVYVNSATPRNPLDYFDKQ
jgi:murein DD-endopeptidase MepM/ murein hydrolase activator NlpD